MARGGESKCHLLRCGGTAFGGKPNTPFGCIMFEITTAYQSGDVKQSVGDVVWSSTVED